MTPRTARRIIRASRIALPVGVYPLPGEQEPVTLAAGIAQRPVRPTVSYTLNTLAVGGFSVATEDSYSSRSYVITPALEIVAGPFYCRSDADRCADRLRAGELVP